MSDFSETIAAAQRRLGPRVDGRLLLRAWRESHRGYHGIAHLADLERMIIADHPPGPFRDQLLAVALLHDAIYHTRRGDNEARSAALVDAFADDPQDSGAVAVREAILETRYRTPAKSPLGVAFVRYDLHSLGLPAAQQLAVHESVYREYQFATARAFRAGRADALRHIAEIYPEFADGIAGAIESLADFRPDVAAARLESMPSAAAWSALRERTAKFCKLLLVCRSKELRDEAAAVFCFHEVRHTGDTLAAVARALVEEEQCGTVFLTAIGPESGAPPATPEEAYGLVDFEPSA